MSMDSGHVIAAAGQISEAVAPAPIVRVVMRPMTKVLNPLVGTLAGRRHFRMAAQIRHVGRRSGRLYVTPVGARLSGEMILIPLTFGNRSDWSQNLRAAGGASIRLGGRDYAATQPEFHRIGDVQPLIRAAFSPFERTLFRMLGIQQVVCLRAAATESNQTAGRTR